MARLYNTASENQGLRNRHETAVDGLVAVNGDLVEMTAGGFVQKLSSTSGVTAGLMLSNKTFPATNQTVEQDKAQFYVTSQGETVSAFVVGGSLITADINEYFSVVSAADHSVDYASKNVASAGKQYQLTKIINATQGVFKLLIG